MPTPQAPSSIDEFNTKAKDFVSRAKEAGKSNTAIANTIKFMYQMTLDNMESPENGRHGRHQQLALSGDENHEIALYDSILASQRDEQEEAAIHVRDYWRVLVNRKGTIFTFLFIVVLAALIKTFMTTPIYRSTVTLQIERESEKLIEYQTNIPGEGGSAREFYETQYNLLKSRTLARRVIDQLGLETAVKAPADEKQSFFNEVQTSISNFLTGKEPVNRSEERRVGKEGRRGR